MQSRNALVALIALLAVAVICPSGQSAESKRIVFVAGPPSHGYGSHAHYAGCVLLAKCLQEGLPSVETVVTRTDGRPIRRRLTMPTPSWCLPMEVAGIRSIRIWSRSQR